MKTITEKTKFIKAAFGNYIVSSDSKNVAVKCPMCKEKREKYKLSIDLESWVYHCWVCDSKGKNIINVIKNHCRSELYNEYRHYFTYDEVSLDESKDIIVKLPSDFKLLGENWNSKLYDIKCSVRYLKSRGVSLDTAWEYRLGISLNGRFKRRIIIPSFDEQYSLNYYVARSIDDKFPKYLNAKTKRKDLIFNCCDIDWHKPLYVVEGVFDLMKINRNAVPLLGSSISKKYILFKKIIENKTQVILCLDHNAEAKQNKIANLFKNYGIKVRTMDTSGYDDIAVMPEDVISERIDSLSEYSDISNLNYLISQISSGSLL